MSNTQTQERFVTSRETAQRLGISYKTIRKYSYEDRLPIPSYKVGKFRLFRDSDINNYIAGICAPVTPPVTAPAAAPAATPTPAVTKRLGRPRKAAVAAMKGGA